MLSDRIFHFNAVDSAVAAAAAAAAAVTFGAFFAAHHAAEARIRIQIRCPDWPLLPVQLSASCVFHSSITSAVSLPTSLPLFLSAFPAAGAVIQVNAAFIHISKRIIPDVLLQNISKIMLIPFRRVQVICPEDLPTRSPHILALAQAH